MAGVRCQCDHALKSGAMIPDAEDNPSLIMNSQTAYYLLPFRFHRLPNERELLVNEVGDYLICQTGTARSVVERQIDTDSILFEDLISRLPFQRCLTSWQLAIEPRNRSSISSHLSISS